MEGNTVVGPAKEDTMNIRKADRLWALRWGVMCLAAAGLTACAAGPAPGPTPTPRDRAAVAVPGPEGTGAHISWRRYANDRQDAAWRVMRDGKLVAERNGAEATSVFDPDGTAGATYSLLYGDDFVTSATVLDGGVLKIALDKPADRTAPNGAPYGYTANDASIGDLDGDGDLDIVLKWYPTIAQDNAFAGYTGETLIDAYTLEGERLWRIDLGPNIRSGAHYTQFIVADLDNDGRAEVVIKTADGSKDAAGRVIGNGDADWLEHEGELEQGDRTGSRITPDGRRMAELTGRVLRGPEYLTAFDGRTGEIISTVDYIPQRAPETHSPNSDRMKELWGDGYANRSDRFLAAVGHFGEGGASAIFSRGYYARSVIAAWDLIGGELTPRWVFDSDTAPDGYAGQGNHQMSVADIDGDGLDEIVFGAMAIDHDGSPLWTSKLGHGDALHVADFLPDNPGLERFGVQETMAMSGNRGAVMLDAATGEILWSSPADRDTGRGVCIDIDPDHPGAECWASNSGSLFSAAGKEIASTRPRSINFAIYWDGDDLREILDDVQITKWDWKTASETVLLEAKGAHSNNGSKATPALSADILGDWREELLLPSANDTELLVFLTPHPTNLAGSFLMEDRTYMNNVIAQNSAYNQPPHVSGGRIPLD